MKIENFDKASILYEQRQAVTAKLAQISQPIDFNSANNHALTVSIRGTYQSHEVVAAAQPAVVAYYTKRLEEINAQLEQLGVKI